MKMKAWELKAGNINDLQLIDKELTVPTDNEVSVAVKTIGLNFADVFAIWGLYSATPKGIYYTRARIRWRHHSCWQICGKREIGDRVMGVTRFGAYATHLNIGQEYVIPIPADWSYEEGASYLVQALTAYYGLFNLGALSEGKTVLIHSAAGGVGTYANRIAKQLNAYTIGSVGGAAKIDYCKNEGYDEVIVRNKKTFDAEVKKALNGRSLDLIMECIGGDSFQIGYDNLGEEGRMIVYGSAQYAQTKDKPNKLKLIWQFFNRPKIDPQGMIHTNKGILGFNLIYLYEKALLCINSSVS